MENFWTLRKKLIIYRKYSKKLTKNFSECFNFLHQIIDIFFHLFFSSQSESESDEGSQRSSTGKDFEMVDPDDVDDETLHK